MHLKLAVISDLHVGNARGMDLNPDSLTERESTTLTEDYVNRFKAFVESRSLEADYLIIPGDVSHRANPAQVDLASDAIEQCASALNVRRDRIVFVPGNHDIDWSVVQENEPSDHYWGMRYESLKRDAVIFGNIAADGSRSVFDSPYFKSWGFEDLLVLGYNSSWDDGPSDDIHHGKAGIDHLADLESHLSALDTSEDQLRLFLLHHHPVLHSDAGRNDFSALQNADRLWKLLSEHSFDLVVHGHKHKPRIKSEFRGVGRHVLIVCAGSFSADLKGFPDPVTNQFHTIEVEGRDASTGQVVGAVKSWSFLVENGWVESKKLHGSGVEHTTDFGLYMTVTEVANNIAPILTKLFEQSSFIKWRQIVAEQPKLQRLSNEQKEKALRKLGIEMGFEVQPSDSESFFLLKEES